MKVSNLTGSFFKKTLLIAIALFFCFESSLFAGNFEDKTYIWLTVDTESTKYIPLIEQVNTIIDGTSCGISKMMDICDQHQMKATFFLSVCESKVYGEERIEKIAQYISNRGHDVQLHPHPEWAYDQNRPALWQYSLQDQIKIIRDGKNLIQKWTGISQIAHRAGGYMADNNTIKALAQNDFIIDSSFFYKNKLSRISFPELEVNSIKKIDGIWQIPITLYMRNEVPANNLLGLEPVIRYRKIDIDWADYKDLESAIFQAQKNGLKVITLFLHSFSFLDAKGKKPAFKDINKFDRILSFIKTHPKLHVVTSKELAEMLLRNKEGDEFKEFVPHIETTVSYAKYFKRRFLFTKTRIIITVAGVFSFLFLLTALAIFSQNRKKKDFMHSSI